MDRSTLWVLFASFCVGCHSAGNSGTLSREFARDLIQKELDNTPRNTLEVWRSSDPTEYQCVATRRNLFDTVEDRGGALFKVTLKRPIHYVAHVSGIEDLAENAKQVKWNATPELNGNPASVADCIASRFHGTSLAVATIFKKYDDGWRIEGRRPDSNEIYMPASDTK